MAVADRVRAQLDELAKKKGLERAARGSERETELASRERSLPTHTLTIPLAHPPDASPPLH